VLLGFAVLFGVAVVDSKFFVLFLVVEVTFSFLFPFSDELVECGCIFGFVAIDLELSAVEFFVAGFACRLYRFASFGNAIVTTASVISSNIVQKVFISPKKNFDFQFKLQQTFRKSSDMRSKIIFVHFNTK